MLKWYEKNCGELAEAYEFPADISALDSAREFVENAVGKNASPRIKKRILIALEEIFVNIASYAYDSGGSLVLSLAVKDNALHMLFDDTGIEFNPLEHTAKTADSADTMQPGGMGILMVKKMCADIDYERQNGHNLLYLMFSFGGENI